jgi:3-oxoacyl-ACP reductase-like protein
MGTPFNQTIPQTLYSFTISASGIIVGTVVASITYSTIKSISATMCFFTSKGTFLLSLLLGYSADYLFGTRIGYETAKQINQCSDLFIIKPVNIVSNKTAMITSVITGSIAGLATCALVSGSSYIISKTSKLSNHYISHSKPIYQSYTPYPMKYLEDDDYMVVEKIII